MNGQQAPAPSRVQALPSAPVKVADQDGPVDDAGHDLVGDEQADAGSASVLPQDENRLARIQPRGRRPTCGGRSAAAAISVAAIASSLYRSTSAMRALNQFMKAEVIRLSVR